MDQNKNDSSYFELFYNNFSDLNKEVFINRLTLYKTSKINISLIFKVMQ
jgi:hypothetical protein